MERFWVRSMYVRDWVGAVSVVHSESGVEWKVNAHLSMQALLDDVYADYLLLTLSIPR